MPVRSEIPQLCSFSSPITLRRLKISFYCFIVPLPKKILKISRMSFLGHINFKSHFTNWNILPPLSLNPVSGHSKRVRTAHWMHRMSDEEEKNFFTKKRERMKCKKEYEILHSSSCSWSFAIFHIVVKFQFPTKRGRYLCCKKNKLSFLPLWAEFLWFFFIVWTTHKSENWKCEFRLNTWAAHLILGVEKLTSSDQSS